MGCVVKRPSLSVVVMAYNERVTIESQVHDTLAFLRSEADDFEVIVVDDGSTDGTAEIADCLAASDPHVHVVHHPGNMGMGVAIRSGYAAASKEFVTQLPGDGQVRPETLSRFLPYLSDYDLVLSTYSRRGDGVLRAIVTGGYQTVAYLLLGNRCAFTGTMVFRRSLLSRLELTCDSFLVNVELPLKLMRLGIKPAFVTIECIARPHGRSKVLSLRRVAQVLREMWRLRKELGRYERPISSEDH